MCTRVLCVPVSAHVFSFCLLNVGIGVFLQFGILGCSLSGYCFYLCPSFPGTSSSSMMGLLLWTVCLLFFSLLLLPTLQFWYCLCALSQNPRILSFPMPSEFSVKPSMNVWWKIVYFINLEYPCDFFICITLSSFSSPSVASTSVHLVTCFSYQDDLTYFTVFAYFYSELLVAFSFPCTFLVTLWMCA